MRHCIPDPKQEEEHGGRFTIYSCEFDDGTRARGNRHFIQIGEDGNVLLLLCVSCLNQLQGQMVAPLITDALRHDKEFSKVVSDIAITTLEKAMNGNSK